MGPDQYLGPYSVEPVGGTRTGVWLLPLRQAYCGLHLPCESGDNTGRWQDVLGTCTGFLGGIQAGQGIRLDVLGAGTVGEREVKSSKD